VQGVSLQTRHHMPSRREARHGVLLTMSHALLHALLTCGKEDIEGVRELT